MRSLARTILHVSLISTSIAFQLPFKLPFFKSSQTIVVEEQVASTIPRVAVIGAGAAGSSAAFWISKAKQRFEIDIEVDVYERAPYIGGRSTTVHPYDDQTYAPVELGASIFVDANKNLMRASKEFNLTLDDFGDEFSDTGIWDGSKFVLVMDNVSYYKSWWTTLKILWRYGYTAPANTQKLVNNMVSQFVGLYKTESPRWDDVADLATTFEWDEMSNSTCIDYLKANGVAESFAQEMVEAATRVNYAQDVSRIHALGCMVCMAATGAVGVASGNFRIFENFLNKSDANVYLNTEVEEISRIPDSPLWTVRTSAGAKIYRGIILAAPFHQTGIAIPSELAGKIPPQPYVHLHVTLLTTRNDTMKASYFGLSPGSHVPQSIFSTWESAQSGGPEPEFNSLSYHGHVRKMNETGHWNDQEEWKVKIFSMERISDEWLSKAFDHVGWVYRKEWDAYPMLPPADRFPPVKIEQGFYYVNAFEPFISTMETETIASRNVVDLLLHEEFGSGICGSLISGSETDAHENATRVPESSGFVLGWDC
ncbi:FAD/NAD(P)-binding domain-containing protein [Boletus edulis BED1]|uniref:FAD/NAD(P)-binding domain-containing protein n=1 Tax=Boletus edulis BED1 TaxID=1328754 RepID=A0AAD4GIY5_BOLED|nr:FAD/NAD(P)-binding domain-containing protein [Boletus edulis BED1]